MFYAGQFYTKEEIPKSHVEGKVATFAWPEGPEWKEKDTKKSSKKTEE